MAVQYPNIPLREPAPNPYQIIGQTAMQVGQGVQEFGQERNRLQQAFQQAVQARQDKLMADARANEELRLKQEAAARQAAEAERVAKLDADRAEFLQGIQGANPSDPAFQERLKRALGMGLIDKGTYDAYQPAKPDRFAAGGGYYEMGPDGKPRAIIAPEPKEDEWTVQATEHGFFRINKRTGEAVPVTAGGSSPLLPKGSKLTSVDQIESDVTSAVDVIDQMIGNEKKGIEPHPGFKPAVGFKGFSGSYLGGYLDDPIQGTAAADFEALFGQAQGRAFLQAFESLKGGGHITEIEGQKGTQAITRMSLSQSERAFKQAAKEFRDVLINGLERARRNIGQFQGSTPPNVAPPDTGTATGQVGRFRVRVKN